MAHYRIYHVAAGGRLRLGDTFQAADDEEAKASALARLPPGQPAELWQGGRMVGRFSEMHEFLPGAG